jgi:hypothetical protein
LNNVVRAWHEAFKSKTARDLFGGGQLNDRDPSYYSYTQARFVVTEWQGITVDGSNAEGTLLGHAEFLSPGEAWTAGQQSQIHAVLLNTGVDVKGWQLLDKTTLFDENEGG